jgi:O-antigen/teichoic acid export membrane protein
VWDAERYLIAKSATATSQFNSLFTVVSIVVISFALCIGIFVEDLLRVMSHQSFWRASEVAHIIIIAYVFQAWTHFTNLGILMSGKTIHMAFATAIACVVMTLAGLFLIPLFAAVGAATAVLSGFVVRFIWIYYNAKRHYDMKLQWAKVLKIAALALAVYGVALTSPDDLITSIMVHVLEAIAFFVLVLTLPILSDGERDRILGLVNSLRGRRATVSGAE